MTTMEDIRDLLAKKIQPELNHLYTAPPSNTPDGGDFGWFCREHALHGFFVLRCLGVEATIVSGDIWVAVEDDQGLLVLTTEDTDGDHSWLSSPLATPIDLSLSTRHFGAAPCPLVFGVGELDDRYRVQLAATKGRDPTVERPGTIYYQVATEHDFTLADLIQDPYLLLNPRTPGDWADQFGDDVYHRVTWHLIKVAVGEIKPLHPYRKQADAIRTIVKRNAGAVESLKRSFAVE